MNRSFIRGATLLLTVPIALGAQQTRRTNPDTLAKAADREERAQLRETFSPWWHGTTPALPPGIAQNVARGKEIPEGIAKQPFPRRADSVQVPALDRRHVDRDTRSRTVNGRAIATRRSGAVRGAMPRGPRR